jgi:hypothetical protein
LDQPSASPAARLISPRGYSNQADSLKSIDALVKRAMEYRHKGLSEKEIGDELHLSPERSPGS